MVYDYFDKYTFICEMYDQDADEMRDLVLNFFPYDNTFQVIDVKRKKKLVRRTYLPTMNLEVLQVGNIVNIFSKLLLITDCADATRKLLFENVESTFALIKPLPSKEHGRVITFIIKSGFRIVRMKTGKIDKDFALELYKSISGSNTMPIIIDYVTSGEVIGLELVGPNAVQKWRERLGATDPAEAAPGTLRRLYGEDSLKNVAHGCESVEEANRLLELYFGFVNRVPRIAFCGTFKNCACCIIKPHAIIDGTVGSILEHITTSGKFQVSAMAMFSVSLTNAKEFYEVYKGVLPGYEGMVFHLAEGKCIALEVICTDSSMNCVCEFRKLCGPRDPDLCRQLYPDTIRALYGKDVIHNGVHCTDLPEDGEMEVEYFFKLLANML